MGKEKKILLLHSSSDLYGASKIFVNTISCLIDAGFIVHVVLSEQGPLLVQLRALNIEVEVIKLGILRRKYFSAFGLVNRILTIKKALTLLSKKATKEQYDIIYSNTTAVLVGVILAKRLKIKHLWHVHEIIQKPVFFTKFIGYLLKKSDLIIVVSNEVRNHWDKALGGENGKIKVIYNGLDYSPYMLPNSTLRTELGLDSNKVLIGMIGRVNNWKGQRYFLEIAAILIQDNPNLHFVMVGDVFPGYEFLYDELNSLKETLNIQDKISDLGFRSDIPNILNGLDLFILPSILPDPLPTVVLESMASSKPVIATRHGGALEMVVEGATGKFIPWNDAHEAAAIIQTVLNPTILKEYGHSGRARVLDLFSLASYKNNIVKSIKENF
jgi:glycosyltransferase involved in cell wall biosynthesis